ncbi:SH3 domain-containing protein [Streptomyces sp. SID13666]|uniref:SH3 domain-containing protein n=1 Tax=Streptomyces TaxID=1883 RepID=UPI00110667B4|nr:MULTISPECIES: SH3 domain-containing protein [Streptomyces]MCZ4098526.1 SH3 domain-containing protein [Streptomyces sp. H39-C1]NEA56481.1 SH3 domain-containing protein [Streptomyces sp. SID13666]NEA72275.1 SH3 domain-containing protein [Streptomyces sp. SID13588]QNA77434.1 SH3 domain-containing protein [Streptomyces sp. So13.3]
MRKVKNLVLGTALAASALLGGVVAVAPAAAAAPAACPESPSTNYNSPGGFTGNGVNIRTGPGTGCTAKGYGYTNHSVTVRCLAYGWVYLTDNTTGVTGWALDDFVTWHTVPVGRCYPPA